MTTVTKKQFDEKMESVLSALGKLADKLDTVAKKVESMEASQQAMSQQVAECMSCLKKGGARIDNLEKQAVHESFMQQERQRELRFTTTRKVGGATKQEALKKALEILDLFGGTGPDTTPTSWYPERASDDSGIGKLQSENFMKIPNDENPANCISPGKSAKLGLKLPNCSKLEPFLRTSTWIRPYLKSTSPLGGTVQPCGCSSIP
jgi:hypothetical protein